jgi:hypothetical protein
VADDAPATVAVDQLDALVVVLDLVRTGATCTRPDMARRSGLGRTVVTQRVQQLLDSGLNDSGLDLRKRLIGVDLGSPYIRLENLRR